MTMRALGVDLGTKRIGLAISDSAGTVATPIGVIQRTSDPMAHRRAIATEVAEWEAEIVVVGLPTSLDGTAGPAAEATIVECTALDDHLSVPVATYDERLTTVVAQQHLQAQGVSTREQRTMVDAVAAAVMLQGWLDGREPPEQE